MIIIIVIVIVNIIITILYMENQFDGKLESTVKSGV